jgi:hypothetical protein
VIGLSEMLFISDRGNTLHMEGAEEDGRGVQFSSRGWTQTRGGLYQSSERGVHHGLPDRILRQQEVRGRSDFNPNRKLEVRLPDPILC